jgi:Alpha/beta hydrolase domain
MKYAMHCALALLILSSCTTAEAAVTKIEVTKRTPFAGGQAYGSTGAYERITGKFHGELDPKDPANAGIVDLDKAPKNAAGRVEYAADFDILKPVDMAKGNGTLFYDVNNRGNKVILLQFNSAAPANDPTSAEHGGNGFLMRQGFTLVWSGWIPGLSNAGGALRIDVPAAPGLEQVVWDEFLFNTRGEMGAKLAFKAASTDKARAALYILDNHRTEPRLVPANHWEFADDSSVRLVPTGTPFPIGVLYQFTYPAANPFVSGIGFAATRDLISFLRNDASGENPLATDGRPSVRTTLAHGTSQSGRYLRDLLHRGLNEDESGRVVFDGMNIHIATAQLFLNQRYAQTNRAFSLAYGFRGYGDVGFPFSYQPQKDPYTGKEDGVLSHCMARKNCPRITHTNTSTEAWQGGNSLITTDVLGSRDAVLPGNVRVYQFASTQHVSFVATMARGVCALPPNLEIDPRPAMRATLVALDKWVKDGTPPPASSYPRIQGKTLVNAKQLQFPKIPGVALPVEPNPRERFDYGPDFEKGLIAPGLPKLAKGRYTVLVPQVDQDGNEIGGVRMPELAVPTGTATGWSLRAADDGGAGELCFLDGIFVPFAKTKAERIAKRDPRLSLAERYPSKQDYVAKVRAAADKLKQQGYLLDEDVERAEKRATSVRW